MVLHQQLLVAPGEVEAGDAGEVDVDEGELEAPRAQQLPPALAARLEAKWEAVMRTATGCDSYASFRANSFSGATKR